VCVVIPNIAAQVLQVSSPAQCAQVYEFQHARAKYGRDVKG